MNTALSALWLSPAILYPAAFIVGTIFGSFFNVIVYRTGQKDSSWIKGASHCENCGQSIAWYDNIPLISYILLGGKSRCCKSKISLIHPLVEFATGLVFMFSVYISLMAFQPLGMRYFLPYLLLAITTNGILWLIILFDLKYMIIPDELVVVIAILSIIRHWLHSTITSTALLPSALNSLAASLIFLGLFLFLWLITKRKGIGLGDVKLIVPLTFLVGFPQSVVGVFFAFIIGGIWGIILLITGKKKFGQVLPFGPFLIAGAWLAMAWGEQLWQAYWQFI